MSTNSTEYQKKYMQGARHEESIQKVIEINLEKKYWHNSVKKFYKEWIKLGLNKIQTELILQVCNMLQMIEESKRILDEEGIYSTTITGTMKVNPITKVLKDSTGSFQQLLRLLSESMEVK